MYFRGANRAFNPRTRLSTYQTFSVTVTARSPRSARWPIGTPSHGSQPCQPSSVCTDPQPGESITLSKDSTAASRDPPNLTEKLLKSSGWRAGHEPSCPASRATISLGFFFFFFALSYAMFACKVLGLTALVTKLLYDPASGADNAALPSKPAGSCSPSSPAENPPPSSRRLNSAPSFP